MSFKISFNTIAQALIVAGVLATASTLWQTATVVERLDERTAQHERRISTLEAKQ